MKALIAAAALTLASGSAWGQASCSDPDAHCRDAKTGREVHFLGTPMTPEMVAEQQAQQQAAHPGRTYTLDEIDRMIVLLKRRIAALEAKVKEAK